MVNEWFSILSDEERTTKLKTVLKNRSGGYITEEENATYRVFSVYETEKELYYTNNNFENDAEYQEFLDELKSRSIVDFKVNVNKDDQILTLSTCADNNQYRVVLHAKKVKKN